MSNRHSREINALKACRPYLRLLQAYNSENFSHNNQRENHSAFYLLFTTIMVLLMPSLLILSAWHLMETESDMKTIVVTTPLCVTLVHATVISIALIVNNRTITETIGRIQKIINQS